MATVVLAIAVGTFLALGLMSILKRTPDWVLTLIITVLGMWILGSMIADIYLHTR